MATDTLEEKVLYPCEPATENELMNAYMGAVLGFGDDRETLPRISVKVPASQIRWTSIQTLCVVGSTDEECNANLKKLNMSSGTYVDHGGKWLILIHPEESQIQQCLYYCKDQLERLMLSNTALLSLDLSALNVLEILSISNCQELTTLIGFAEQATLRELEVILCTKLKQLPSLDHLTQLSSLRCIGCDSITQLPKLDNLVRLNSLHVYSCHSLTQLPSLDKLAQLTDLLIFDCNNLTSLPSLNNLTRLTTLTISRCTNLLQIPSLENLTQLTRLSASKCSSLTQLPALDKLTQLTGLSIYGCESLMNLPPMESLKQLTHLDLSDCVNLTQLPKMNNLTCLIELDLSGCSCINELPEEIRNMRSLRKLCLCNLKLRRLPEWLPEIAERFSLEEFGWDGGTDRAIVYLGDTTVENIKDMSIFEQSYEMVVKWFSDENKVPLNEIKVVFLGDGEAGKSRTIARLMNDGGEPVDYVDTSTPGIVIKHRNYIVDDREFRVHYWDFGGQEIMHSMHRIFLTNRTMYVVLINARDDTQGDRAQYWLHNIKSFAPEAPVLLVLNKIDQNPKASVDERTLRARYSGLTQIVRLSALKFDQDEFNKGFTKVLLEEIKNTGYLDFEWPGSWIQVKHRLESMDSHYILGNEYKAICQQCQVNNLQTDLLHWFNDLGVSFCFCDKEDYTLKKHVILRPNWITNGLYIILFNECIGANNGHIPHAAIYDLLERASLDNTIECTLPEASYDKPGDIEYVLGVMRKFQLSLDSGDGNEFIPMLCQQDSTVDIHYYEKDTELLEFCMEFEYLPDNLLHRLMVERYSELDKNSAWRKGARFQLEELGLSAVVVVDGKQLRFFIQHTDSLYRPNVYLTMLKANVDRIVKNMGLHEPECILVYKHENKVGTFDYEELRQAREDHETSIYSKVWRKRILIEDILKQSAPDGLEDERKLLDTIRRSCQNIQGEPDYRLNGDGTGMEDKRNRRIRDDLHGWGYNIQDQSQRGRSPKGKGVGELDLLLHNDKRELWTTIEALRVSNGTKAEWNKHLDKLIRNYNFFGARFLYLLTYVDADPKAFARIWNGYQKHIQGYNPGQYTYTEGSFVDLDDANSPLFVKTAKCQYSCGDDPITVYHIFARIPPYDE